MKSFGSSTTCSPVTLLLVVAMFLTSFVNSMELCTVCTNGGDIRYPNEEVCQNFDPRTNGLFQTDNDCRDIQLEAYQKGCCNNPPMDHCDYCADGTEFNPDGIVPSGQFVGGESCFDYKYANSAHVAMFQDGTCDDTMLRRAGQYCGCPNQVQECWLCPDGNPPNKPAKADQWVTGSNCRGIEFLFSLLTKNECASFPLDAGADLAIFCGCGDLNETEIEAQQEIYQCELCRSGGVLTDPKKVYTDGSGFSKTCKQADDFAREIIKTPYACNNPRYFEEARNGCCSNGALSGGPSHHAAPLWMASMSLLVAGAVAAAFV